MPRTYQINIRLDPEKEPDSETIHQFEELLTVTMRGKTHLFRYMVKELYRSVVDGPCLENGQPAGK